MSILQRSNQASAEAAVSECNDGTSPSKTTKGKGMAPSSGQLNPSLARSKRKKSSKTNKLLRTIGGIAAILVLVNWANSLVHDGTLPKRITVVVSQGGGETRYSIGTKGGSHRRNNDEDDHRPQKNLHFLPPPRNLRNKLNNNKKIKEQGTQHKKKTHVIYQAAQHKQHPDAEKHVQKYHEYLHHKKKAITKPGDHKNDHDDAALKRVAAQLKPVNGQQLQHQKEAMKGEVHNMEHYFSLSRKEGHDKEKLLKLLHDNAGIRMLSQQSYDQLPSWGQVISMYGDRPKMMGLDQCEAFRADGDPAEKFLAVAGAFNSGTNLLAKMVTRNCVMHKRQAKYGQKHRGVRWQVPYGKHTPPSNEEFRNAHVAKKSDGVVARNVLPAVMIRDPFRWLQSMCGHHYTSRWPRVFPRGDPHYHCPNLFPLGAEKYRLEELEITPIVEPSTKEDIKVLFDTFNVTKEKERNVFVGIKPGKGGAGKENQGDGQEELPQEDGEQQSEDKKPHDNLPVDGEALETVSQEELDRHYFPVRVRYSNFTRDHKSLVHFYNDWYQEYLDLKDYPNVMVRMEDLLFFPDDVVPQICECAGGQVVTANLTGHHPIRVVAQSAKAKHSTRFMEEGEEHTGYLDALIKYGKSDTRFRGMTPQDLQYAGRHLDANIMDLFGYDYPDKAPVTSTT